MVLQSIHVLVTDTDEHTGSVIISVAEDGGWKVTALLDGQPVATRTCYDWHRVERARKWLESEIRAKASRLISTGLLLAWLAGGFPSFVLAHNRAPVSPVSIAVANPSAGPERSWPGLDGRETAIPDLRGGR